jgi:hypothetical protein
MNEGQIENAQNESALTIFNVYNREDQESKLHVLRRHEKNKFYTVLVGFLWVPTPSPTIATDR